MRRITIDRPLAKVRGIKRRLRAIDKWSDSFDGYFPSEHSSERYWNCKLPVLDRLVAPPITTNEIQAHCASALLRAIKHLSAAKPEQFKNAIVTALITYPDMFGSEICIFFDNEYYESFFKRNSEWESLILIEGKSLSEKLDFQLAESFTETGFDFSSKDEWEGEVTTFEQEWWSYRA